MFMITIPLGHSAIEILPESDGRFKSQARFPGGKRVMSEGTFSQVEDAILAALDLFADSYAQADVYQSFERLHQLAVITLLLVYSYLKSEERDLRPLKVLDDETTEPSSSIECDFKFTEVYGEMRGPIGDYEVQDLLMYLGYLENISTQRSRWAGVLLTQSGARVAQAIQNDYAKTVLRLPGLP
jgi:hypothetical protein